MVAAVDKYIVENEPWALGEKQDEDSRARLATVLYTAAEALRIVTALAHPVIPDAQCEDLDADGAGRHPANSICNTLKWGQLRLGTKLGEVQPVFPRADKSAVERMQKMEEQGRAGRGRYAETQAGEAAADAGRRCPADAGRRAKPPAAAPDGKITIDDFAKVELRVGVVKVAEKVKNADKLLRLEVDIGTEVRQIVAGIAEAYAPETLIGRKVVIVANLRSAKAARAGIERHDRRRVARRRTAGAGGISGRRAGGGEAEVRSVVGCWSLAGNCRSCRPAG